MHELPPLITEFEKRLQDRENLAAMLPDASDITRSLIEEGVRTANSQLVDMAAQPEVQGYYNLFAQTVEKASAELDAVAETLERLGMVEELAAKRAELAAMQDDPRMKLHRYIGTLTATVAEVTYVPEAPAEGTPAQPEAEAVTPAYEVQSVREDVPEVSPSEAAVTPEVQERKKVQVRVDPIGNITVNNRPVSLSRKMVFAGTSIPEAEIRKLRVATLKIIASEPGKEFTTRELIDQLTAGRETTRADYITFSRNVVEGFLREAPESGRTPLVVATKVHKKLWTYRTDFDISFEDSDKRFSPNEEPVYTAPNGTEKAGKAGRILVLLSRATKDAPLFNDAAKALYSKAELRSIKTNHQILLSGRVSSVREFAAENGLKIVSVFGEPNPQTGRRQVGYYLEPEERVETSPQDLTETEQVAEESVQRPTKEDIDRAEELEAICPIKYAAVFTSFLNQHGEYLAQHGLLPLPREVHEAITKFAFNGDAHDIRVLHEQLNSVRKEALETFQALLADPVLIDGAIERLTDDDPRFELVAYLEGLDTEHWQVLSELLSKRKDLKISVHAPKRGGTEIIELVKRYDGEEVLEAEHALREAPAVLGAFVTAQAGTITVDAPEVFTPVKGYPENVKVPEEQTEEPEVVEKSAHEQKIEELRRATDQIVGEILQILEDNRMIDTPMNLNQIGSILKVRSNVVFQLIDRDLLETAKDRKQIARISPSDVLTIGLASRLKKDFFEPRKRSIILDQATSCLHRYREKHGDE